MERLMLECAVRAALGLFSVAAVLVVLRIRQARIRHTVWTGVAVWMLTLPAWTAWGPKLTVPLLKSTPAQLGSLPAGFSAEPPARIPIQRLPAPVAGLKGVELVSVFYFGGLFLLLLRLAVGTTRARRLVRRAAMRNGRLTSELCASPVTVGWLNPSVILPEAWLEWPRNVSRQYWHTKTSTRGAAIRSRSGWLF